MLVFAWFVKPIYKQLKKQTTKKAPEGQIVVPPGLFRYSKSPLELNHAADYISRFHEVECFLNIIDANLLRDHRI